MDSLGMIVGQLVGTAIFIAGMWFIFDRKRMQKTPTNPEERLETYARIAVHAVEQLYPNNPGKKDLAIGYVIDLYKEWESPIPSKATIAMAIEASVLLLPKTPEE